MEHARASIRRCAVYTRKSSEEGLEQDFNSLAAQREACDAFIRSQAGEGWRLVKTAYDDGDGAVAILDDEDASPEVLKILKARPLVLDVQRMMANTQGFFPYREPG